MRRYVVVKPENYRGEGELRLCRTCRTYIVTTKTRQCNYCADRALPFVKYPSDPRANSDLYPGRTFHPRKGWMLPLWKRLLRRKL